MHTPGIHAAPVRNADEAGIPPRPFDTPPAFPCALPADVARLRPQFMAEPDEHGDAHHAHH